MCGITGVIAAAPVDPTVIDRMRDALAHRGPDHAATWLSPDGRVGLGHRRLSVIDLSPAANQPFASSDGRFLLVYNGELYNHAALRKELEQQGVQFRTVSDSEVLVESFRRWGSGALERFSGMFAFAIWDQDEHRLFCARDRAGEKPFYYAVLGDTFLFASEPKSLLEWPGWSRRLHYPALLDFLAYGFVPDPKCIWENCHKLSPGHCMVVRRDSDGRPIADPPQRWFNWNLSPDTQERDWTPRLLETITGAAREMTIADVPLGVFLSGGVDSSTVAAALARAGGTVKTFTIGFSDGTFDEREWARAVAERYRTEHHERMLVPGDVSTVFQKLLWQYDEPFSDQSFLPTYYLSAETRKEVTVALSGDGADETFAGYRKYSRMMRRVAVRRFLPDRLLARVVRTAADRPESTSWLRRQSVKYGYDVTGMLTRMLTPGLWSPRLKAAMRGPLATQAKAYHPRTVIADILKDAPQDDGLVNTLRYVDFRHTLAGDILVKVDRASMAVALEVRPVYLHRDMLQLAGAIPGPQLADRTHTKEALKVAAESWLPAGNIRRGKQGFLAPLDRWLREAEGADWTAPAGSMVSDLLDPAFLADLKQSRRPGSGGNARSIHQLMLLDHWLAVWQPTG
ncbi:MAG TPA: asparagine synthase (glutamine-hydrolyzing) [Gemmatimonadales bacterium]|nr:asparagine synthase (glutamine-hydrolyzing) [Gemmatimonadales bacterium]